MLLQRSGLDQPALGRIAAIVHDIDLKEQRYQAPETGTIAALVEGVRQAAADDHDMLERGTGIFEALYRSFETAPKPSTRRRST